MGMEWQAVVLALQILLLAVGWLLFQRARGELSAHAAEIPVLTEIRTLQKTVRKLLIELASAADRHAMRIESGCANAEAVLAEIEARVREAEFRLGQQEERLLMRASPHAANGSHPDAAADYALPAITESETAVPAVVHEPIAPPTGEPAVTEGNTPHAPAVAAESLREKIFVLADSGLSTAVIAQATQMSEGEVETLIGLRVRR
jgi:hypothetical protein